MSERKGVSVWVLAAAVLIAALIGGGIALVFAQSGNDEETVGATSDLSDAVTSNEGDLAERSEAALETTPVGEGGEMVSPPEALPSDTAITECPAVDDGDQVVRDLTVEWVSEGPATLPFSSEHGPYRNIDPVYDCFRNSPSGAVLAAAHFIIPYMYTPEIAERMMTPGPERDSAIARSETGNSLDYYGYDIKGFQVVDFSSEGAMIEIAMSQPAGTYVAVEMPMVWSNGDWLVDSPATVDAVSKPMTSTSGYLQFVVP